MGNIARSSKGYWVRLSLIGFLFILLQNTAASPARAASLSVSPQNLSVLGESVQYSDVDARNYEKLALSFRYNAEKLEVGDQLYYGWKTTDDEGILGTVNGRAESVNDPASANDETGEIVSLALPTSLANTQFQLYFQNTGTTSGVNDQVDISLIKVDGQAVKQADTMPPSAPVASLPSGSYNATQSVTLSSNDDISSNVAIYYTVDGTAPDKKSQLYTTPIEISVTQTVRAVAFDESGNASEIALFIYMIDTIGPVIENVQYSNAGTATNADVTVRITTSKPVNTPEGWTKETDTTFTKRYSKNTDDSVMVTDGVGNVSESRLIEVRGIDKTPPVMMLVGDEENGVYVGSVSYTATDDKEVHLVTVNGAVSPISGVLSQPGSYTIVTTDSAGNTLMTQLVIAIPSPSSTGGGIASPPAVLMPLSSAVASPAIVSGRSASSVVSAVRSGLEARQPSSDSSIAGSGNKDSIAKDSETVLAPSNQGWKLWGVAWYWYALAAGLIGAGWWILGPKLKTSREEF